MRLPFLNIMKKKNKQLTDVQFGKLLERASKKARKEVSRLHFKRTGEKVDGGVLLRRAIGIE